MRATARKDARHPSIVKPRSVLCAPAAPSDAPWRQARERRRPDAASTETDYKMAIWIFIAAIAAGALTLFQVPGWAWLAAIAAWLVLGLSSDVVGVWRALAAARAGRAGRRAGARAAA